MTTATNSVNIVRKEEPSIGFNPNTLRAGMKLTETYKETSLFEVFKTADVNQDGIISENEFELYDKKETLNKEYWDNFNKAHQFDTKKHGLPLAIAGLLGGTAFATQVAAAGAVSPILISAGAIAVPVLGLLAIGALGYAVYNVVKTSKEQNDKKAILNEQLKKLDEEYKDKIDK